MKRTVHRTVAILAVALAATSARAQTGAQETDTPGVTSEIAYARQYNGALHVGILFRNTTAKATEPAAVTFNEFTLVEGGRKHFPLKGPDGRYIAGPVSDWNSGGRLWLAVPANGQVLVWAVFTPVSATKIDVSLPTSQPFDAVPVTAAPPAARDAGSALGGLRLSLVSAMRTEGQLKVRLKIANSGKAADEGGIEYADAYVLDPASKKKYTVVKDADGNYLAQPVSDKNNGGRFWLSNVSPGRQTFMALTFTAPPDAVKSVDIVIPEFEPLENVALAGQGGAADEGQTVEGRTIGLRQALQDLHAAVTPRQVKVSLAADVLFDFDKADLKKEAEPALAKIATVVEAYPGAGVTIDGFTDAKGGDAYNLKLSEQRAAAVATWLTRHAKVAASQLRTKGWGKAKPIAPNTKPDGTDNPVGRAKNRRVEITIVHS
ncbi:MAG: OmpA family protein [Betaproteobacteria bacterium]